MRIIPKLILSSTGLFISVAFIIAGNSWMSQQFQIRLQERSKESKELLNLALKLQNSLQGEMIGLRDFLLLGNRDYDMHVYQNNRTKVFNIFEKLEERNIDSVTIDYLRQRHSLMQTITVQSLSVAYRTNYERQITQDLRAISSYQSDMVFVVEDFVERLSAENQITQAMIEKQNKLLGVFEIVLLSIILVLIFLEFRLVFLPLIESISDLQKGVKNFSSTNLSYRLNFEHKKDEIGELAQAFNDMADRLAAAYNTLEQQVKNRTQELHEKNQFLEQTLQELQQTQTQLIQSEKMSSLGQMVAGIAHEVNNPINFIYGNLKHAQEYVEDLLNLVETYQQEYPNPKARVIDVATAMDLEFLQEDMPRLLNSMQVGTERIRDIVKSLRTFSRLDEAEMKEVDIHDGLESTLLILQNRLKKKPNSPGIELVKNYGSVPLVECYAGQLNQVFLNLMVNAIDAMEDPSCQSPTYQPTLTLETIGLPDGWVRVTVQDNGMGIPPEVQQKLFEPFFTTKAVGKGTGLGLAISYQIITDRHRGRLFCESEIGQGTRFVVEVPLHQPQEEATVIGGAEMAAVQAGAQEG